MTLNAKRGSRDDAESETFVVEDAAAFAENQRGELVESDVQQALGGGGKPGQGFPAARQGLVVRRLMPVECERLQALPDDWTLVSKAKDGKRYSGIGDAVTANVAEWIGSRLADEPPNWREIVAAIIVQRDLDALPPVMPDLPEQMELA